MRLYVQSIIAGIGYTVWGLFILAMIAISSPLWGGILLCVLFAGCFMGPFQWAIGEEDTFDMSWSWHPAYKLLDWMFPEPSPASPSPRTDS